MKSFLNKISWIGADIENSKFWNIGQAFKKILINVHNIIFLIICFFLFVFYSDMSLFHGYITSKIFFFLGSPESKLLLFKDYVSLLYVMCTFITAFVSLVFAVLFYLWRGKCFDRQDILGYGDKRTIVFKSIREAFIAPFAAAILFFGGFVISILILSKLSWIPGSSIIQIIVISKIHALIGLVLFNGWSLLMPYGLVSKKNS